MLTISKPLSAGQAQTYHQKEFTAKEQNYWSQQGVIAGEWQGRSARQFGLGAFTRALPPSVGLRSVPSTVSPCFSSIPL
jgi:hypothetical protein